MSVRAALAAVGCAALLAATAVVLGPIAPAQAAGSCSLIVPATLAVSRPYQAVILKLSADCAARQSGGWAAWDAYHPTKGYQETCCLTSIPPGGYFVASFENLRRLVLFQAVLTGGFERGAFFA